MNLSSYPKIWALGHNAIAGLFLKEVLVEEKIDGSQFSFGRFNGELLVRSKGAVINPLIPPKMFERAVRSVEKLDLHDGYVYRGEVLDKPKHNTLSYNRTPKDHVILFDVTTGIETYMEYDDKAAEAERIGLEVVPRIFQGMVTDVGMFRKLIDRESCLGGPKMEGCVVKQYKIFGEDKKVLLGKFVSEAFKEIHTGEWKKENPAPKDILSQLGDKFRSPARWEKALQHIRDAGLITDSPKDIALLVNEVPKDILEECREEIVDDLMKWAWPHVRRQTVGGLAEWYKQRLLERSFEQPAEAA